MNKPKASYVDGGWGQYITDHDLWLEDAERKREDDSGGEPVTDLEETMTEPSPFDKDQICVIEKDLAWNEKYAEELRESLMISEARIAGLRLLLAQLRRGNGKSCA